jgi:cell wall-associated NlpC family hydrolase
MTDARSDIVSWAESQVGIPYKFGGTGPKGYDCSGLTSQAYKNGAGISIPRTAAEQQGATTKIKAGDLKPADLCFEGTPAYHVVMYAGNNQVVAADHSGTLVRVRAFTANEYTGGFGSFGVAGSGDSLIVNTDYSNGLAIISNPLKAFEGVYNAVQVITDRLTNPQWWRRVIMGAIGLLIAGIALEFVRKGLQK